FDLALNEVQILNEVTFLIGNFLGVQKMSEFREDSLIDLKGLFRIRVAYVVTANEAKELRLAQQLSLKFVELGDFNLNIRDNPPAARHFATAVCILDLGRGSLLAFVVVIVVVGFVRVVSLDQPPTRRVPLSGRQRDSCALTEREYCLYQTFSKTCLTDD